MKFILRTCPPAGSELSLVIITCFIQKLEKTSDWTEGLYCLFRHVLPDNMLPLSRYTPLFPLHWHFFLPSVFLTFFSYALLSPQNCHLCIVVQLGRHVILICQGMSLKWHPIYNYRSIAVLFFLSSNHPVHGFPRFQFVYVIWTVCRTDGENPARPKRRNVNGWLLKSSATSVCGSNESRPSQHCHVSDEEWSSDGRTNRV